LPRSPMFRKLALFLRMVKFSHSVFALPFALTGAVLAAQGLPPLEKLLWIGLAMVGARSGAMGMNRILDRKIDALNPRTRHRELPSGKITLLEAWVFSLLSFALLVYAAWRLNPLCLKLSPLAIALVVFYSFTKRFTWGSHFFLGLAISAAPLGGWLAVRDEFAPPAFLLALAVLLWLAGFDILYALQDVEFDRTHGLFSIPQRFGVRKALQISRLLHVLVVGLLGLLGLSLELAAPFWAGLVVVAGLLLYEHSLVREDDLSRLNTAFFNVNGWISISVLVSVALAYLF